jgi:hypothetical protein
VNGAVRVPPVGACTVTLTDGSDVRVRTWCMVVVAKGNLAVAGRERDRRPLDNSSGPRTAVAATAKTLTPSSATSCLVQPVMIAAMPGSRCKRGDLSGRDSRA